METVAGRLELHRVFHMGVGPQVLGPLTAALPDMLEGAELEVEEPEC